MAGTLKSWCNSNAEEHYMVGVPLDNDEARELALHLPKPDFATTDARRVVLLDGDRRTPKELRIRRIGLRGQRFDRLQIIERSRSQHHSAAATAFRAGRRSSNSFRNCPV